MLMNDFQKTQGKNLKKFAPEKCLNGKINKGTLSYYLTLTSSNYSQTHIKQIDSTLKLIAFKLCKFCLYDVCDL